MKRKCAAFTLIELLVVVAIIGVLATLLFAIAPSMLKKAHQTQSLNNLRQIAVGFTFYVSDHDGRLPSRPEDGNGEERWPAMIYEYLKDKKVFAAPDDPENYLKTGKDPLSNDVNNTSYIMNSGLDWGISDAQAAAKEPVMAAVDQPSKTILLGVVFNSDEFFLDVAHGDDAALIKPDLFGTSNDYAFMDGSARTISKTDYQNTDKDSYLWLFNKSATASP